MPFSDRHKQIAVATLLLVGALIVVVVFWCGNELHTTAFNGTSNKVVSMSLYGSDPRYTVGVVRNAELVKKYLRGWTLRVYIEDPSAGVTRYPSVPPDVIKELHMTGAQVSYVPRDDIHTRLPGKYWRWLVMDDPGVDVFVVRDADSRLTRRDVTAIKDWLNHYNTSAFHCIRDHPRHTDFPVQAGLWGARRQPLLRALGNVTVHRVFSAVASLDLPVQPLVLLNAVIWPAVNNAGLAVCHDSVVCKRHNGSKPFSTHRRDAEFVGQTYDAKDVADRKMAKEMEDEPVNEDCNKN